MSDLIGKTLGEYVITDKLGEGGMGVVYRGRDDALGRDVAIKVLPADAALDRQCVKRFTREAQTLARIRHPNLMHVYSVGQDKGLHYYAMELIEGLTLADLLAIKDVLNIEETWSIAGQVALALSRIHSLGVIHRDVKPANVMIEPSGRAILMDFGLARDENIPAMTTGNAIMGTPEYMSPEQASCYDLGPATDQYALGIMMYKMLSGSVPFNGRGAIQILRGHCEDTPLPPVGAPSNATAIIMKMLEKNPDDRYPSLSEFAEAMSAVCNVAVLSELSGEPPFKFRPQDNKTDSTVSATCDPTALTILEESTGETKIQNTQISNKKKKWKWIIGSVVLLIVAVGFFKYFTAKEKVIIPDAIRTPSVKLRLSTGSKTNGKLIKIDDKFITIETNNGKTKNIPIENFDELQLTK